VLGERKRRQKRGEDKGRVIISSFPVTIVCISVLLADDAHVDA